MTGFGRGGIRSPRAAKAIYRAASLIGLVLGVPLALVLAGTSAAGSPADLGPVTVSIGGSESPNGCGTFPVVYTFTAEIGGGGPPVRFVWSFGDGTTETGGDVVVHGYEAWGTFNGSVRAIDATGETVARNFTVANFPPPCATTVSVGPIGGPVAALLLVVGLPAGIFLAVVLGRRRRPGRRRPPSPGAPAP